MIESLLAELIQEALDERRCSLCAWGDNEGSDIDPWIRCTHKESPTFNKILPGSYGCIPHFEHLIVLDSSDFDYEIEILDDPAEVEPKKKKINFKPWSPKSV